MALYIGLMSGTSMDGIDAALVEFPSNRLLMGRTKSYSEETRNRLNDLLLGKNLKLASLCQLDTLIGKDFALATIELLEAACVKPEDIDAIGSHGQTVCHDTAVAIPYTLQLGCAHTISSLTGIDVIADFRRRDIVNGGQGAPFAPIYHEVLFGQSKEALAVVNIGGIANISLIRPNQSVLGFDVGPGNCLMDAWIQKHLDTPFDAQGAWARTGSSVSSILHEALQDPFFRIKPPKSIGKEYFSLNWLETFLKGSYTPEDIQATLVELTAYCIAQHTPEDIQHVYLCGGGTHNQFLKERLAQLIPTSSVSSCVELGIDPDYIEAMLFAWLAWQSKQSNPLDLSKITGSKKPAILGAFYKSY